MSGTGDEFPGLSKTECSSKCSEAGCVISGRFYCAHPCKTGLAETEMNNKSAIARIDRARTLLKIGDNGITT